MSIMFTGAHTQQFAWCGHEYNGHLLKYGTNDAIFTWQYSSCSTLVGIKLPLSCTIYVYIQNYILANSQTVSYHHNYIPTSVNLETVQNLLILQKCK